MHEILGDAGYKPPMPQKPAVRRRQKRRRSRRLAEWRRKQEEQQARESGRPGDGKPNKTG
jgi:hypothetical protein